MWYAIPSTGNFSEPYNFYVLPYDEQSLKPASNWVLLAVRSHDTNTIKWMPGNVVFPIPEPNQEVNWGSNFQQFGRGAVKTTINGLEGTITTPTTDAPTAYK